MIPRTYFTETEVKGNIIRYSKTNVSTHEGTDTCNLSKDRPSRAEGCNEQDTEKTSTKTVGRTDVRGARMKSKSRTTHASPQDPHASTVDRSHNINSQDGRRISHERHEKAAQQ